MAGVGDGGVRCPESLPLLSSTTSVALTAIADRVYAVQQVTSRNLGLNLLE